MQFQPLQLTESQGRYLMGQVLEYRLEWLTSVRSRWSKRRLYKKKESLRKGIEEKLREKRERKNYCSINFHKQRIQQSISSNNDFPKFYIHFSICLPWRSLLAVNPFVQSLAFSPILYKFIVLGSLGLNPNHIGLGLKNSDPTIGAVCGNCLCSSIV